MNGLEVKASLPFPAGKLNDPDILAGLKMACYDAWPNFRQNNYVTGAATLAAGTYQYTITPAVGEEITDEGIARLYVTVANQTPVMLSGWREHNDASIWSVEIEPAIAMKYAGGALAVEYQSGIPAPVTMNDTLLTTVPRAYWVRYVSLWLIEHGINVPLTGQKDYNTMLVNYRDMLEKLLREKSTHPMTKIGCTSYMVGRV